MLCGWGVKAGMAHVWWQVKLCDPCIARVISRDRPNSREKTHDFTASFENMPNLTEKFTVGV